MTIHGPAQLTTVKGSIPRRINLSLAVGCTLLNAYQYFVLPLWLLPHSAWWAWTLVPCGLATWTMWAVLHEAFHGVLHPASRLNKRLGRWLAMQFFVLFRVVQFGHLTHHRFNRFELDRPDIVVPGRPLWLTRFIYYLRLLGGLYLGEMAYALVVWLPRRWLRGAVTRTLSHHESEAVRSVQRSIEQQLLTRDFWQLRRDALAIGLLLGASLLAYREVLLLWLAMLGMRGAAISLADNAYHYGMPVDAVRLARNLRLPAPLGPLLLHFNLHQAHHDHPYLPWTRLPAVAGTPRHGEPAFLMGLLHQFRGPVPEWRLHSRIPVDAPDGTTMR